ncbi:MAG: hypothetical protein M4579_007499 [Chaenotheca gracillima]|nr:MAG: hypothetical protein M4579_007499 [Chaenotheca gracillima]
MYVAVSCLLESVRDLLLTSRLGGRQKAACCTVQVAPVKPAVCSYDLCREKEFCPDDEDSGTAQNKRDLAGIDPESSEGLHTLEKRGQRQYTAELANGHDLIIFAIAVRAISQLFQDRNANTGSVQPIRTQFRLRPGTCIGPAIDLIPIGPGRRPPGLGDDETEHPLEPQFSKRYFETITSGLLGGTTPPPNNLQPVDANNIEHYWNSPLHGLQQHPQVGGPSGIRPFTANDRMMEGFGSVNWPQPLMAVDKKINNPKGRMFRLQPPTKLDTVTTLAASAAHSDQQRDVDALLSTIRIAFAIFEYMNTREFITNYNLARDQVRTQLGFIETEFANAGFPIPGAQEWWDVVLDDHMRRMEDFMIDWVAETIDIAEDAYMTANGNLPGGGTLSTWASLRATLNQWRAMVITNGGQGLRFARALYSATFQPPQPPGGSGGGGTGGGSP